MDLQFCHSTLLELAHRLFPEFGTASDANDKTSKRGKLVKDLSTDISLLKRIKAFKGHQVNEIVDIDKIINSPEYLKKYIDSLDVVVMVGFNPEYNACCILHKMLLSCSDKAKKVLDMRKQT